MRTLDSGYAAIVKGDSRVQFRFDSKAKQINICRKGAGARDGGRLNMPCLFLASSNHKQRIDALSAFVHCLDIPSSEREATFQKVAVIKSVTERMQELQNLLDISASWFYSELDAKARDPEMRSRPFKITELLPPRLSCLGRHLREKPKCEIGSKRGFADSVEDLILEEGLEESILRCGSLPICLAESIISAFERLSLSESESLLTRLNHRMQSPLQRLHFLGLALKSGKDIPITLSQAKADIAKLLDPGQGIHAVNALLAIVRWSFLNIGWCPEAQTWPPETRLRVAWLHGSRIQSIFVSAGFSQKELAACFAIHSQGLFMANIDPVTELDWDVASPHAVKGLSVLICALAAFATELPEEFVSELGISTLFEQFILSDNSSHIGLMCMWHDTTLRSNVLQSYLGDISDMGLRRVVGNSLFEYLTKLSPGDACESALTMLEEDPYQLSQWVLIAVATNRAPLLAARAARMDKIIDKLNFSEAIAHNSWEAVQLVMLASGFASRDRPISVSTELFGKLLGVAEWACLEFPQAEIEMGLENDASKLAGVLLAAALECRPVQPDIHVALGNIADNLYRMIGKWPAMARLARASMPSIMRAVPLAYQVSLVRVNLLLRASA